MVLKEWRLVLVVREAPLSEIHLENMLKLARMGASIVPPVPAFYTRPKTLEDTVDHIITRGARPGRPAIGPDAALGRHRDRAAQVSEPARYPDDRPRAATIRSRLILVVASELVGTGDWPYKQVRIDLRDQGATGWPATLFACDGRDAVREVLAGRAQIAIINPTSAIVPALRRGPGRRSTRWPPSPPSRPTTSLAWP